MIEQKIKLRLPNARQKLQPLFPEDNRGDIKILFAKKTFKLQKAFLRLQSTFFKKTFSQANELLQIKQNFNQNYFSNVLKCFYGFTIEINRSDILDYYPIIKYLQVQSLLKIIREDISKNLGKYNTFTILLIAHQFNQQELFQNGLSQLQRQNYEQLRYSKNQLMKCPIQLFKLIIKTHNRLKSQNNKGISFLEIDQLIKQYSQQKRLNEAQHQQLKFELIDKKSLNSQEYKEIFLTENKKKNSLSMIKSSSPHSNGLISSTFNNNIFSASKLTQSVIQPLRKINDELTLQIENTYEKKKNQELQAENINISNQLTSLSNQFVDYSNNFQSFKTLVNRLQQRLDEKDRIDKEQTNLIKKLQKICQQLRSQLSNKNDLIKKLQERVVKLEKQPQKRISGNPKYIPYDEQQQDQSKTVQSHIVPGHLLKQMAKPAADALNPPNGGGFKKAKQQKPTPTVVAQAKIEEELDQDQIQELYISRLEFDREPLGCNKRFLPKLANFLTSDGFQKKKLQLVFRRNNTNQQTYGQTTDIRNKNSLLFIICTKLNQVIGGFTTISLNKNSYDYLSDQNAFLFSLTKDQKFNIKKSRIKQAIYISSDYLIGFSNDLMIYTDCIKTPSECSFPDAYENNGQKRTPKWLTGQDNTFYIKSLEIYEVKQQEMQMDLF